MDKIAAGILAGGQSSRMGESKAALLYNNMRFLDRTIGLCKRFSTQVVSVDREEKYQWIEEWPGIVLVEDELAEFGPVEGIYQILRHIREEASLILATDMPLLTEDFLLYLAGQYQGEDALVVTHGGKPQALCSIYSRSCLNIIEQFRKEDIHKPGIIFQKVETRYIAMEETGFEENLLENVNTPEEYDRLLQRWGR